MGVLVLVLLILAALAFLGAALDPVKWSRFIAVGLFLWVVSIVVTQLK